MQRIKNEPQTIVLGMSGGVDSSVAAVLLKNKGKTVIGLFMNNWEEKDDCGHCTAEDDWRDVQRVAAKVGIPCYSVNFAKEYMDHVFKHFLKEYKQGRTPNPDVLCNREIKFGPFLRQAKVLGADKIATGHYARVEEKNGEFFLKKSVDLSKDQTYFLNQLNQNQLSSVIFPLGEIEKTEVRNIAKENGLSVATKKDSTGVCFIGERNFKNFLKTYLPAKPGDMKDKRTGKVVGHHDGLMYYTLGQRKGLGIGGSRDGTGESWFVVEKDMINNILYVTQGEGNELLSEALIAIGFNWIPKTPEEKSFDCYAKFRYRQPDQPVHIIINDDKTVKVVFKQKQRAITPGQYVVLYDNEGYCLGGGEIDKII